MNGLSLNNQRSRSFAQATFYYDGKRDYEQVETFLTAAKKYKSIKNIADIDAIRSLPCILKGDAIIWWNGIKDRISTWKDFELQLRKTFAPKKPGYVIFQEIAALRQQPNELTERFVAKQRALFSQLPSPGFTEVVQLDMMYGCLHPKIQELIPRECIETFDGLLEAARVLEQELLKDKPQEPQPQVPGPVNKVGRKRVRCTFCRCIGHIADVCRKKQKNLLKQGENSATASMDKAESATTQAPAPSSVSSSDVKVNDKVAKINEENNKSGSSHLADVCRKKQIDLLEQADNSATASMDKAESADTQAQEPKREQAPSSVTSLDKEINDKVANIDKENDKSCSSFDYSILRPRPMIEISIGTAKELAYVDSGTETSLASFKLYSYLKNIGFHFQEETTTITMADGFARTQNILTGRVPVKLHGRCILTTFMVWPEARKCATLLGMGFLIDAGIVLNLPQLIWNFNDEPDVHYDLLQEDC